jgi:chromosome partitioning protein
VTTPHDGSAAPVAAPSAVPAAAVHEPDVGDAAQRLRDHLRESDASTPIGEQAMAAVRIRSGAETFPKPAQRRVITVSNQKGGVGKTTSAVNLAVALALHGAEVLVVDLDPQGNASTALGVPHHTGTPDVYAVLIESLPMAEAVQVAAGVDRLRVVPATLDLAGAELELVPMVAREHRLQRAISAYCEGPGADLDYVIIDCPPSLGLLTVNAMVATSEVLIPIQCEYYALEGLGQLLKTIEMVKAHLNPRLAVSTVLLTMYDGRTNLADQVADEVRGHFGELVLSTMVPRSVRVSEAPGYGQSVVTYDPGSRGALAYVDAAREMAIRGAA